MKTLALAVVLASTLLWAQNVTCPLHPYATCYDTGRVAPSGAHLYHCTCGDDVWVGE